MRLVLPILAALTFITPTLAQDSPAQLRRQIDQLTEQIAELEAEVARANERIEKLIEENRRLRDALRSSDRGPGDPGRESAPEETKAEIPDDPFAAPAAMRAHIERQWNQEFGDIRITPDDVNTQYLRSLRRWASSLERDLRGDFTWRVFVERAAEENRQIGAVVRVLDQQDRPIGDPASVTARGVTGRLLLAAAKDSVIIIEGRARINLNVSVQHGAGDELVGPYLMFEDEYEVTRARYE